MTEEDMFFTHTIVGSALSLPLGNIPMHAQPAQSGLLVNMRDATTTIDQVWKDWVLLQGAYPYVGRPRPAPGRLRRSLERHALLIASVGLVLLVGALSMVVAALGLPILNT
jgi:hypothetical protein